MQYKRGDANVCRQFYNGEKVTLVAFFLYGRIADLGKEIWILLLQRTRFNISA